MFPAEVLLELRVLSGIARSMNTTNRLQPQVVLSMPRDMLTDSSVRRTHSIEMHHGNTLFNYSTLLN